jgi:hypothetical protein
MHEFISDIAPPNSRDRRRCLSPRGLRGTGRRRERPVVFFAVHRIQGSEASLSLSGATLRAIVVAASTRRLRGTGRRRERPAVFWCRLSVSGCRFVGLIIARTMAAAMPHAFQRCATRSSLLPRSDRGERGDDGSVVDLSR